MKNLNEITTTDLINILKSLDRKTWIRIGIITAISVLLIIFVIWPAWFSRVEVKGKIKNLDTQLVTLNTLQQKEAYLRRTKEESLRFIYGAKERLFKKGEASLLLGQISKLADESQVTIVSSSPKPFEGQFPVPFDSQYESSQYAFAVEGRYHDVGSFISKIESYPKLLRVESFQIVVGDAEEGKHVASLTLSAVSFKQGVTA